MKCKMIFWKSMSDWFEIYFSWIMSFNLGISNKHKPFKVKNLQFIYEIVLPIIKLND